MATSTKKPVTSANGRRRARAAAPPAAVQPRSRAEQYAAGKALWTTCPRESHADLLAWFEQIPHRLRVAAVKAAIRGGGLNLKAEVLPSDDEVKRALDALLGI